MLSSTSNRNDYVGTGLVDTYAFTFKILEESDLVGVVRDTDGVEEELAPVTDFTVSAGPWPNGGTITLVAGALGDDYTLTIRRVRPLTQETDLQNQAAFYPTVHETSFDHGVMIDQQQQEQINRSVKLPTSVSPLDADPTLPVPEAGKVIGWNAAANALVNLPIVSSIVSVVTGVSQDITYLAQGAGAVTRTMRAKWFDERINVIDYGADPTGATSSKAAFLAAAAALPTAADYHRSGGTIFVPRGLYDVEDLTFTDKRVNIIGDGNGEVADSGDPTALDAATVLFSSINAPILKFTMATRTGAVHGRHSVISDLAILGDDTGAHSNQHGIVADNRGLDLHNVTIGWCGGHGYKVTDNVGGIAYKLQSWFNHLDGVNLDSSAGGGASVNNCQFIGGSMLGNLRDGLRVAHGAWGLVCTGTDFELNAGWGVNIATSVGSTIGVRFWGCWDESNATGSINCSSSCIGGVFDFVRWSSGDPVVAGQNQGNVFWGLNVEASQVSITGNTVAASTVVSTDVAHGLTTGDLVTIAGSNSTPSIDGQWPVTVTGGSTFTIPVRVTGAGSAGSVVPMRSQLRHQFRQILASTLGDIIAFRNNTNLGWATGRFGGIDFWDGGRPASNGRVNFSNADKINAKNAAGTSEFTLIKSDSSDITRVGTDASGAALDAPPTLGLSGTQFLRDQKFTRTTQSGTLTANRFVDTISITASGVDPAEDVVIGLQPPVGLPADVVFKAWISAADTVMIRLGNITGVNITTGPGIDADGLWQVWVRRDD